MSFEGCQSKWCSSLTGKKINLPGRTPVIPKSLIENSSAIRIHPWNSDVFILKWGIHYICLVFVKQKRFEKTHLVKSWFNAHLFRIRCFHPCPGFHQKSCYFGVSFLGCHVQWLQVRFLCWSQTCWYTGPTKALQESNSQDEIVHWNERYNSASTKTLCYS